MAGRSAILPTRKTGAMRICPPYGLCDAVSLARNQHPIIEIEDHGGIVDVSRLQRKIRARTILGGDRAEPERADILAAWQFRGGEDLRPGEHRAACKQRRHVAAAIDRGD